MWLLYWIRTQFYCVLLVSQIAVQVCCPNIHKAPYLPFSPTFSIKFLPTTFQFNLPIWPVKKFDYSWRIKVNYLKCNQVVVTQIIAAVPDVVSLLKKANISPNTSMQLLIGSRLFYCCSNGL